MHGNYNFGIEYLAGLLDILTIQSYDLADRNEEDIYITDFIYVIGCWHMAEITQVTKVNAISRENIYRIRPSLLSFNIIVPGFYSFERDALNVLNACLNNDHRIALNSRSIIMIRVLMAHSYDIRLFVEWLVFGIVMRIRVGNYAYSITRSYAET